MLRNFEIDQQYITDVSVETKFNRLDNPENPTFEDLIKIIKGSDKVTSLSHKDHDEFTKLRNFLEAQGYITTERNSWNGDRVVKSFKLNGWTFRKGRRFPCATALKNSIHCAQKFGWKTLV
jgi:hypothetical protein